VVHGEREGGGGSAAAALQPRTGERGLPTCGALATVSSGAEKFDSISNFKRIQLIFKFIQVWTGSKMTFPG
jgi:hypothetical protein